MEASIYVDMVKMTFKAKTEHENRKERRFKSLNVAC